MLHKPFPRLWILEGLKQRFPSFLMLQPFLMRNTVSHVVMTPNNNITSLLLHNCSFATVMNHTVHVCLPGGPQWSLWEAPFTYWGGRYPQVENNSTKGLNLLQSERFPKILMLTRAYYLLFRTKKVKPWLGVEKSYGLHHIVKLLSLSKQNVCQNFRMGLGYYGFSNFRGADCSCKWIKHMSSRC